MNRKSDAILFTLAAGVFFIFFNGYMLAPIIPGIARELNESNERIGLAIPAYLLTYGLSTLIYGPISDRIGRKNLLITLLALTSIAIFLGSFAWSGNSLIAFRIFAGACAGGFLPISLALVGDLYPFEKLGRAMGWMFGAVAGGSAFGSTVGAWLNPVIGWRNELIALACANLAVLFFLWRKRDLIPENKALPIPVIAVTKNYISLLHGRSGALFALIFLNGMFHSGVFSWLGLYLVQRYQLSDAQIGTALLGYGIPGMLLGPMIGKLADRWGRQRVVPVGFFLAAGCALALTPSGGVVIAALLITLLSLGFDMTHPLMAGLVSTLDPKRRGQAMGLNAFAIFTGFGFGALAFQLLMGAGMARALLIFSALQIVFGFFALKYFRSARSVSTA